MPRLSFLFLIAILLPFCLKGQLNIKVAFLSTYGSYDGVNGFLNEKDAVAGVNLVDGFKDVHVLSGLDLGLRYKLSTGTAFEGGWNFGQPRVLKQSRFNDSNTVIDEKWKMQNNGLYLGMQQHLGAFSFGSAIQYNRLNMSTIPANKSKYEVIEKAPYWTAQFFIQLEYRTNFTAIALRPHYSLPITSYQFDRLNTNKSYSESLTTYGLSLIIYNGE
ncbi:MAG: hypothetical protein KDC49_12685 [Saprospiraceae bacterium]|nr:hypothetical protein [Saprospiraceae bacterium]